MTDNRVLDTTEIAGTVALDRFGFRALLGWHYLVLFSPLLAGADVLTNTHSLFVRQLVLYASIGVAFLLLITASHVLRDRGARAVSSPAVVFVSCAIGALTTGLMGLSAGAQVSIHIYLTILLGASEAILMFLWLHYFVSLAEKQPWKTLGTDVSIGGVIAFCTASLITPSNVVIASLLPFLAAFSLVIHKPRYDEKLFTESRKISREEFHAKIVGQDAEEESRKDYREKLKSEKVLYRITATALFALVFGLVQGAYLIHGTVMLVAENQFVFLGIVFAGIVIYYIPEGYCTHSDSHTMYRYALLFFVAGIALLTITETALGSDSPSAYLMLVISNLLIFAGFNLFDFGNLAYMIGQVKLKGRWYSSLVDWGRAIAYFCLSAGLVLGMLAINYQLGGSQMTSLYGVCSAAIIILAGTVVLPRVSDEDSVEKLVERVISAQEENLMSCSGCGAYGSCEIRKTVEDYFEQHKTVAEKQKPENPVHMEAETSNPAREFSGQETPFQESERGEERRAVSTASRAVKSKAPSDEDNTEDVYRDIAKLYQLSKRETEAFMLVSKGRNAEYVAKEMVISIHTAKTHIANIYRKLDVHSSQELLDLIDEFEKESRVS